MFATAERMAADSDADVLWLTEGSATGLPPRLCVAPLEVWGPMRDKLLTDKTVVMTSATLMLGGDFDALATSVGLKPTERVDVVVGATCRWPTSRPRRRRRRCPGAASTSARRSTTAGRRSSTSPATCRRPGRDGLGKAQLDEIVALVDAAEGRTLGLFSARAAPPRPRPRRSASGCPT